MDNKNLPIRVEKREVDGQPIYYLTLTKKGCRLYRENVLLFNPEKGTLEISYED